jgi:acetyltransferase-like isoleucine patch superfamily enzyme
MPKIAQTAIILPNVVLEDNVIIEDFCIIGIETLNSKNKITRIGAGSIIRSGTYIYQGNSIGKNFQTGNKVNIREDNFIADDVSIGTSSVIEHNIKISNGVRIHSQVFIPEFSLLEENCWIGPNVVFTNAKFPKHPNTKDNLKGPVIKENAKIGANVTILPDIIVGSGSLIGAGSVITKNVDSNSVVIGNPAKKIRTIDY